MTGILLTTPGGSKFFHACPSAEQGLREMESIAFTYGTAWTDPKTVIEFGSDDGTKFTPTQRLRPKE